MSVVFIALPALEKVEPTTFACLWNVREKLRMHEVRLGMIEGCTVLHALRNDLIRQFLMLKTCEYLWFVDSDMVFPSDMLDVLLGRDKDIVGAFYVGRTKPYMPCVFDMKENPLEFPNIIKPQGNLFKVGAISTGCLLIRRNVLERMPSPWFYWKEGIPGEDLYFCWKASQYGFDIWCDASKEVRHIGKRDFGREDFDSISKTAEGIRLIEKGALYV